MTSLLFVVEALAVLAPAAHSTPVPRLDSALRDWHQVDDEPAPSIVPS
jgi:hypothetical protein